MKSLRSALVILLIVHVMALIAGVVWLRASGRLNRDRLSRVVEMFKPTIDEEASQQQEIEEAAAQAQTVAADAARMRLVATGPATLDEQLDAEAQLDEMTHQKLVRLRRDIHDLQQQLTLAKQTIAKQETSLAADRKAFAEEVDRIRKQREDENFTQAVAMFEQLKARQAKEVFADMMAKGRTDDVVDYLAAMQLRKAAAVLKEFKEPREATQAAELIDKLRRRGVVDPTASAAAAGGAT